MRVAITGGSGSLGRALIGRLVRGGADRIVTFTRDEQKRAALARDFDWHPGFRVYAGDVRDERRMADIFAGCEVVVHAAARKVVTAHPDEPEELLKTNVLGTVNVIDACRTAAVQKLIVISSDKSTRAENIYGISKAMAEHLAVMANARTLPKGLRIGVVRYGNVIGSNGSVVPLWRRLIAEGKPIPLSDPAMTRFWITLGQAVDLVLEAVANLRGGEVIVPVLPAAPILTLAAALMPDGRPVETAAIGIRQGGEKLHEELLAPQEVARAVRREGMFGTITVPPWQNRDMWDDRPWLGEPLPADTVYRSDVWPIRLDVEGMRRLLTVAEAGA